MKLPDRIENISAIYPLKLPISKLNIKFTPFNLEQEKGLILGKMNSLESLIDNYYKIANECIVSLTDIGEKEIETENKMELIDTLFDFVYLHLNLRAKSESEVVKMEINCESEQCKKSFEFEHNIIESLKFKNEDKLSTLVKVSDDLSLNLKPLPISFLKNLNDINLNDEDDITTIQERLDYYRKYIAYSTKSIIYKNEIYSDFTPTEIDEKIIRQLSYKKLEEIFNELSKLIHMYMLFDLTCPHCGHKMLIENDNFLKLLN